MHLIWALSVSEEDSKMLTANVLFNFSHNFNIIELVNHLINLFLFFFSSSFSHGPES